MTCEDLIRELDSICKIHPEAKEAQVWSSLAYEGKDYERKHHTDVIRFVRLNRKRHVILSDD